MEGTNDVGTRAEALVGAAQQMPAELAVRGATPTAVGSSGGPQEATMLPNGSITAGERNQNMPQALTVVTVSTGKQGGGVARGLVERGRMLRAVTGDPNSSQAKVAATAGSSSDLGGGR
jgi:hypothetical protein